MSTLSSEYQNVQNVALGGVLLWNFCVGYEEASFNESKTPFHLIFLVLPLLFHEETCGIIGRTRKQSGLRAFVEKFNSASEPKNDVLLNLHERTIDLLNDTYLITAAGMNGR